MFRLLLLAKDLRLSRRFYESLLATRGRLVAGGRVYFDCGSVILGIVEPSAEGESDRSTPLEAVYFATKHLEAVHRRARKLRCLSPELLHDDRGQPMGEIVVRPWGERSFYAMDPAENPLCFVDDRTLFTGTRGQIATLKRAR